MIEDLLLDMESLYDQLYAGKVIECTFPSQEAAAAFRTAFHRAKKLKEDMLITQDFMAEADRPVFEFKMKDVGKYVVMSEFKPQLFEVTYILRFADRQKKKLYTFTVVDE